MRKLTAITLGLATAGAATTAVALLVGLVLAGMQKRPPALDTHEAATLGAGDVAALAQIAGLKAARLGAHTRLALALEDGAEVLELFRLLDEGKVRAWRDPRPLVRYYGALHRVMRHPERAPSLVPLTVDETPVTFALGRDALKDTTVGAAVAQLACLAAEASPVAADAVREAAHSWRMLAARSALRTCATADGSDSVATLALEYLLDAAAPPVVALMHVTRAAARSGTAHAATR